MVDPLVRPALWIAAALCVALPASASGAVTIGSNLGVAVDASLFCGTDQCTVAHRDLPATSQAAGGVVAPSDGVVVRWRIKAGNQSAPVALRITRPGNSSTRTGAGTGPTVTPAADTTSTFDVRLRIEAGDALGIDCCQNAAPRYFATTTPGAIYDAWGPRLVDGEAPRSSTSFFGHELLINADIEPDADSDGFGDETQDECPTDASTQGPCPSDTDPPETTITKDAPNRTKKSKVKFKFTSTEPDSTFECKLDKKAFKPCSSPKKLKRLKRGKHKFKVRATDAAGNVDPSPAKDRFKVVG